MRNIVIATIHSWHLENYKRWQPPAGFSKYLINRKEDLTIELLRELDPQYIFFPHWSWIIPLEIYENFECVIFHMTDVPFGRGGSPMQNLILRGIYETKVSALRCSKELDAGPVYLKYPFDIANGSAEELYKELSAICFGMMTNIIETNPIPQQQVGQPTYFKRRKPEESELPLNLNPRQFYDFVRMLDAPGYPRAFIKLAYGNIELYEAQLTKENVLTFKGRIEEEVSVE